MFRSSRTTPSRTTPSQSQWVFPPFHRRVQEHAAAIIIPNRDAATNGRRKVEKKYR